MNSDLEDFSSRSQTFNPYEQEISSQNSIRIYTHSERTNCINNNNNSHNSFGSESFPEDFQRENRIEMHSHSHHHRYDRMNPSNNNQNNNNNNNNNNNYDEGVGGESSSAYAHNEELPACAYEGLTSDRMEDSGHGEGQSNDNDNGHPSTHFSDPMTGELTTSNLSRISACPGSYFSDRCEFIFLCHAL
jgi:hypothetical protein